eukprot:scaffold36753_cov41-Cyclotella_meneghiniana.AAC.5
MPSGMDRVPSIWTFYCLMDMNCKMMMGHLPIPLVTTHCCPRDWLCKPPAWRFLIEIPILSIQYTTRPCLSCCHCYEEKQTLRKDIKVLTKQHE